MDPALRRGDREGVGGGSRMLRLHAQLISASAAARMNVSKCLINDAGLGGTVWLPFVPRSELALVSYKTLASGTRFCGLDLRYATLELKRAYLVLYVAHQRW